MDARGVLTEGFGRVVELFDDVADGLDAETLHHRPGGTGNSIAWLLWHTARMQDAQVAALADGPQVWEEWRERVGVDRDGIGYGDSSEDVDAVRIVDVDALVAYQREVALATARHLETLDDATLEREIDPDWDPPVREGQRLVSILADALQHLGQAAYVRGLAQPQ